MIQLNLMDNYFREWTKKNFFLATNQISLSYFFHQKFFKYFYLVQTQRLNELQLTLDINKVKNSLVEIRPVSPIDRMFTEELFLLLYKNR